MLLVLWHDFTTTANAALVVERTKPFGVSALPMTKRPAWPHLLLQAPTQARLGCAPTARTETYQKVEPTRPNLHHEPQASPTTTGKSKQRLGSSYAQAMKLNTNYCSMRGEGSREAGQRVHQAQQHLLGTKPKSHEWHGNGPHAYWPTHAQRNPNHKSSTCHGTTRIGTQPCEPIPP